MPFGQVATAKTPFLGNQLPKARSFPQDYSYICESDFPV